MRFAILVSFALLALPFTGCKPAPAPSFPVTEVVAPAPDSPDDAPQFPDKPTPVVPVADVKPVQPAARELEQCTGPGCGERAKPVRNFVGRVLGRR